MKTTIEVNKEIMRKHEDGVCVFALALKFGSAMSWICTILKNREAIKDAVVANGMTVITRQRSQALEQK